LAFNGELVSSKVLADKLYQIKIKSATTQEQKTFISTFPIKEKDNPPHQTLQVYYKILKRLKNNKKENVLIGYMQLMNF